MVEALTSSPNPASLLDYLKLGRKNMSLMKKVNQLIHEYISLANKSLIISEEPSRDNVLYLFETKEDRVIKAVNKLESHQIFKELVNKTRDIYQDDIIYKDYNYYSQQYSQQNFDELVKNFFRRSGAYIDCLENNNIDLNKLFKLYHNAFQNRNINVKYLLMLDLVNFDSNNSLDFGSFVIRRYTPDQLYELVNNRVNRIFYPKAFWNTDNLSNYWFIEICHSEDISQINRFSYKYDYQMLRNPIEEPSVVNNAIYNLLLFDWDYYVEFVEDEGDRWDGFEIAFIKKIDNNLIIRPSPAPYIVQLESTGYHWAKYDLNIEETTIFKEFVMNNKEKMDHKLLETWPFLSNALEYLKKAFFTPSFPNAVEQLLWHIATIEALLGEDGQGVTKRLRTRLSRILEKPGEPKIIGKLFKNIYDIRSDLVHGNSWKEGLSYKSLVDARDLARRACLWFLTCLSIIRESLETNHGRIPTREDILALIDFCEHDRFSLIDCVPREFPFLGKF